ncbi:MAG: threonine ammonia-lyase, biosynthetic [Candidatus Sumerlaeia bacterium]
MSDNGELQKRLFHEILMARRRVYGACGPTPIVHLPLNLNATVYLKREDLSVVNSFKWRGAYNRMAMLSAQERARGVVAASAGNHAQGVALAACQMGIRASIYMPRSTPRMKQLAVKKHGGDHVEIILHGDTYDEAADLAQTAAREQGLTFIHPYDDLATMGGQGTLADEVVMSGVGAFDVAYVQIGGGGLAAAVALWLRTYYPSIRVIGVEGVDQASMQAAMRAGSPVELDYVDVFCDGTAVKKAGELTFRLCRDLLDDFITVSNEEVCAAIQVLWESLRCVPEPSGAMGLAGLMKQADQLRGQRVLCILCGANMDFGQLAWVARHAGIGARRRRYFRFEIGEKPGAMLDLIQTVLEGINIIEFQYGKTHPERAWPVIGFEASPMELDLLDRRLQEHGIAHEDVTSQEDVEFRLINYEPRLFHLPFFIKFEFPERAGALRDFLQRIRNTANICYFNYVYTGERVGRALMGFEFSSENLRSEFLQILRSTPHSWRELDPNVLRRIL